MAKPMVSTAVGCEGIGVEREHLLVADSAEAFAAVPCGFSTIRPPPARSGRTEERFVDESSHGCVRRTAPASTNVRRRGTVVNLGFHGIGAPERELEPDEDQFWIDGPLFEQLDTALELPR